MGYHPIDVQVGLRIRQRRSLLGVSQTALAEAVGLTFQQIQKYESGANRVSSSRLFEFATLRGVPVEHFFEGAPGASSVKRKPGRPKRQENDHSTKPETLKLVRAYYQIQDAEVRGEVSRLIIALAQN